MYRPHCKCGHDVYSHSFTDGTDKDGYDYSKTGVCDHCGCKAFVPILPQVEISTEQPDVPEGLLSSDAVGTVEPAVCQHYLNGIACCVHCGRPYHEIEAEMDAQATARRHRRRSEWWNPFDDDEEEESTEPLSYSQLNIRPRHATHTAHFPEITNQADLEAMAEAILGERNISVNITGGMVRLRLHAERRSARDDDDIDWWNPFNEAKYRTVTTIDGRELRLWDYVELVEMGKARPKWWAGRESRFVLWGENTSLKGMIATYGDYQNLGCESYIENYIATKGKFQGCPVLRHLNELSGGLKVNTKVWPLGKEKAIKVGIWL